MRTTKSALDHLEEILISLILGLMTVLTFANVVARYALNSNILWALEVTVFMFGWLVLLGASYAVKKSAHLGVDVVITLFGAIGRRRLGLISALLCIIYGFLLLKGSWDYWANFANLPATEGRWFPHGFEENFRGKGWYETEDTPMPTILGFEPFKWMEAVFNDGDPYEKIPRLVPYVVLPVSMGLLLFRFLQQGVYIWMGTRGSLIASHEVEEAIDEVDGARQDGER